MQNKKSGIRLRHLQQKSQEQKKRDLSPSNPNRKKIFDYNQRKVNEKLNLNDNDLKKVKVQQNNNQYQQLIQNLKKKSMQVQLRDQAIRFLNNQIEELKDQLRVKDKQIAKLNLQIQSLQKNQAAKQYDKEHSKFYKQSETSGYVDKKYNDKVSQNSILQNNFSQRKLQQDISLMNLNCKNNYDQRVNESEVLSPFMALNNNKASHISVVKQKKQAIINKQYPSTSRISSQDSFKSNNNQNQTDYSGFIKKKNNYQFDFSQQDTFPVKRTSMIDSVNKQLQKFNIFPQKQYKNQVSVKNKLQIEDSRQFKFEQFQQKGFSSFANNIH